MPTLTIDNLSVTVSDGATVLDAARQAGVEIPTLCHRPDLTSLAGCMVCAVREDASNRVIPACATPAADGMRILTAAPDAQETRRFVLELLLSNHAADCEGPCQAACPTHFDIPVMLEQLSRDDPDAALATVLKRLALPVTLGHICPAPCEKVCRRSAVDAAVSICAAKRYAGEQGRFQPVAAPETGKRVVVVGSGPTGLAAAFYLRLQGHACHIVEATPGVGDALLKHLAGRLPHAALEKDVARLRQAGVTWSLGKPVSGADATRILAACDGMVLAAGAASAPIADALGIPLQKGLVAADRQTFQTAHPQVFAGGAAIQSCKIAVLACAHGRAIAENLGFWMTSGRLAPRLPDRFRSSAGKSVRENLAGLLADVENGSRCLPPAGGMQPATLAADSVRYESARCLRCACHKKETCRFRDLCTGSQAKAVLQGTRTPAVRVHVHPDLLFESAKCVLCGICVRTAARMGAACGPAFHGRGFDMRIGPPYGREWTEVPREVMLACIAACPTGAMARVEGV